MQGSTKGIIASAEREFNQGVEKEKKERKNIGIY